MARLPHRSVYWQGALGTGTISPVSEVSDLEQAVADAVETLTAPADAHPGSARLVGLAGEGAVRALRRFQAHPASRRPGEGGPDPLKELRHDVRAAAQTVLAELELIALGWPSWDDSTRDGMLGELADACRLLDGLVDRCVGDGEAGVGPPPEAGGPA